MADKTTIDKSVQASTGLKGFLVLKSEERVTSYTHLLTADEKIKMGLRIYLPDEGLIVGTKIIQEEDGESLTFDISLAEGWSQATTDVLSSLRFREIADQGVLLARPNYADGSLATIPNFKLYQARMLKEGDKINTVLHWLPLIEGKQKDYVFTCWIW